MGPPDPERRLETELIAAHSQLQNAVLRWESLSIDDDIRGLGHFNGCVTFYDAGYVKCVNNFWSLGV